MSSAGEDDMSLRSLLLCYFIILSPALSIMMITVVIIIIKWLVTGHWAS